jgi:DNA primase
MSSAPYTAKEVKRMRESRMIYVDWGDNDMSLTDLFRTSKRFRAQVLEHTMPPARLFELTDKLESDILALESVVAQFPGA